MSNFKERREKNVKVVSLMGMDIHGYWYYDTRTRPVNMQISNSGYPFLIFVFYPLRVLSADTTGTNLFYIPNHECKENNTFTTLKKITAILLPILK